MFIVVLLALYLIYIVSYKSSNIHRHMNSSALYAHYSKIDRYNYFLFPRLFLANPIRITVRAGESLYIPKNWWHWVRTTKKSFATNYWFLNEDGLDEPFMFDFTNTVDLSAIEDEPIQTWNSSTDKSGPKMPFKEFYESGVDNLYIITLHGYHGIGTNNLGIKKKLRKQVRFPTEFMVEPEQFDYNFWSSSGFHDTKLHYDDEDGILNVIEGEKEVLLFSPKDTPNLYKIPVEYPWVKKQATDHHYNIDVFMKNIEGPSSSQLLFETCKHDNRVLANITTLAKKHPGLVWGFKKRGDEYRWELYKYSMRNSPHITSWDIYSNQYEIGDKEHYYYNLDFKVKLPFWGYGMYLQNGKIHMESGIFVVDKYDSFRDNYEDYMKRLGFPPDEFKSLVLDSYECYELSVHHKTLHEIFIQYLGISKEDFLEFLREHGYPQNIIDFVGTSNYKINNEITIVYDVKTSSVIRTAFYGVL
jgi:hypothetical protein